MIAQKTTLNPYLAFQGNTRDVMEFYKDALDGNLEIVTYRGSPAEKDMPEEFLDKVMHATLTFGDAVLMASDNAPNRPEVKFGDNITICIGDNDREKAERFFNNLSDGGVILMPFEKTFWGSLFGMCVDRFGVQWMVDCEVEEDK